MKCFESLIDTAKVFLAPVVAVVGMFGASLVIIRVIDWLL